LGALNADPSLKAQINQVGHEAQNQRMQNAFGHIGNFMQAPAENQNYQSTNQNYPQAPM